MELHLATPSLPYLLHHEVTTLDRMAGRDFDIGRALKVPHVGAAVAGVCEYGFNDLYKSLQLTQHAVTVVL